MCVGTWAPASPSREARWVPRTMGKSTGPSRGRVVPSLEPGGMYMGQRHRVGEGRGGEGRLQRPGYLRYHIPGCSGGGYQCSGCRAPLPTAACCSAGHLAREHLGRSTQADPNQGQADTRTQKARPRASGGSDSGTLHTGSFFTCPVCFPVDLQASPESTLTQPLDQNPVLRLCF